MNCYEMTINKRSYTTFKKAWYNGDLEMIQWLHKKKHQRMYTKHNESRCRSWKDRHSEIPS